MSSAKLNPQIQTIEIGIKSLREVVILPLSLADQTKTARILSKAFQDVMGKLAAMETGGEEGSIASMATQLSDIDVVEFIVSAIQENLETILKLVVDESEVISMGELTNNQFYQLVEVIYKVNYEEASKNFAALLKRAKRIIPEEMPKKKASHSKKSSLKSVESTTTD